MEFVVVLVLVAFSTALQGTVGFGFAVALTPVLALLIDPRDAVALTLVLGLMVAIGLYLGHSPKAPPRGVMPIVIGGLLGTPIGLAVLLAVDEQPLRVLIGAAVVVVAIGQAVHGRLGEPRQQGLWPIGVGVGVGMLSGRDARRSRHAGTASVGLPALPRRQRRRDPVADVRLHGAVHAAGDADRSLHRRVHP